MCPKEASPPHINNIQCCTHSFGHRLSIHPAVINISCCTQATHKQHCMLHSSFGTQVSCYNMLLHSSFMLQHFMLHSSFGFVQKTVEMVMRSTVSIVFILNIDEVIFAAVGIPTIFFFQFGRLGPGWDAGSASFRMNNHTCTLNPKKCETDTKRTRVATGEERHRRHQVPGSEADSLPSSWMGLQCRLM